MEMHAREQMDLTQQQIDEPNNEANQREIARSVLESTGRSDQYDLRDVENVTVYFGGELTENEDDVVVSANFGPKNTVIAAYTADGDVYEYIGDIGNFYGVANIKFIPSKELGQDIVIVRERINQSLGAFEETDVLRGYVYEDEGFRDVLNTPEKINASWNQIWNNNAFQKDTKWNRVTEETESVWGVGEDTEVTLTRYQNYQQSDDIDKETVPEDETFQTKDSRVVVERFYWSPKWERFILGEAVEKTTGEQVAIVENLAKSPYILAGFSDAADFGIVRADDTFAYVSADDLENIIM